MLVCYGVSQYVTHRYLRQTVLCYTYLGQGAIQNQNVEVSPQNF